MDWQFYQTDNIDNVNKLTSSVYSNLKYLKIQCRRKREYLAKENTYMRRNFKYVCANEFGLTGGNGNGKNAVAPTPTIF